MKKGSRALSVVAFALVCDAAVSLVQGDVTLESHEKEIVISDVLKDGATVFERKVRFTVFGGDVKLRLLASDLKDTDANLIIDRSNVRMPDGVVLNDGRPVDVPISVTGIAQPGVYEGELQFVTDPPAGNPLNLRLELNLTPPPNVVPVFASLGFQVSRCIWWAEMCGCLDLVLPGGVVNGRCAVPFDNLTGVDVPIEPSRCDLFMRGEKRGIAITDVDVLSGWPERFRPGINLIELKVPRIGLPADRYQGSLRVGLEAADAPVSTLLVIDVRDGVLWPIVVLLLAILFGRYVHKTAAPEGGRTLARVAATLAGTPESSLLKALAFLALLVMLVLIGLKTLYVDNATFGAQGALDYLGLFLWGMSSDIAQRTLQNLPKT